MIYFLGFLLGLVYDLFEVNLLGGSSIKIILAIYVFKFMTQNLRLFSQKWRLKKG